MLPRRGTLYAARMERVRSIASSVRVALAQARAWVSALSAALLLALIAVGCAPSPTRFDRIGTPVRFGELRETAAWCPGFDPSWWKVIDAKYAEYDRGLDALVAERWEPFATDISVARVQGRFPDARAARVQWGRFQQISRELAERELALVVELERALPREAGPFIGLLRARAIFRRACAPLREPGETMPGPLEVLALNGRGTPDPALVAAATDAYILLATDADDATRTIAEAFIDCCEALGAVAVPGAGATAGSGDEAARTAAREAAMKQRTIVEVRALERFRLELLRRGSDVGASIADDARRADYLSRLDAFLHAGVRSAPSLRAFWQIGRGLLARKPGIEPAQLARFDALHEEVLRRDAELRPRLRSGSKQARQEAYQQLVALVGPMREFVDKTLSDLPNASVRAELATFSVTDGTRTPAQAADAIAAAYAREQAERAAQQPTVDRGFPGRDRWEALLLGAPLRRDVLQALCARVRIPASAMADVDRLADELRSELRAQTDDVPEQIGAELRALRGSPGEAPALLRGFMASFRARIERVRTLDRAANERILAEIARAAAVSVDDERVAIARLELALLSEIGADPDTREAEGVGGLTSVALVNPFEVVRSMGADESQRVIAESVVFARGAELMAAQRDARAVLEGNVRALLGILLQAELSRAAGLRFETEDPWRPRVGGVDAVTLRFRLADDLRAALGEPTARAYLARLRELAEPAAAPSRAPAFLRLDRFAAGSGMSAAKRSETDDIRTVVAELLDQADERREASLNALLRWRGGWTGGGDFNSPDRWNELARSGATGWLLRSRAIDADERAFAACESLLGGEQGADPLLEDGRRALREFPLALPRLLQPQFESR